MSTSPETPAAGRDLTDDEIVEAWIGLEERWGIDEAFYWYPIAPDFPEPPHALVVSANALDDAILGLLIGVLEGMGVETVVELTESEMYPDRAVPLEELVPYYAAEGEGFWTDWSFDWVIYASHEGSITIAGARLVKGLKAAWPSWEESLYVDIHETLGGGPSHQR